jgi:uncharacterized protein YjbI with pentapeptide repeats
VTDYLANANLYQSDLTNASLIGANLANARLSGVTHLASAVFSAETVYNQWTVFPA